MTGLRILIGVLLLSFCLSGAANANGGPFVIKYPSGDPSAKGVLARLDPDLKPAREDRLRVLSEDLDVSFGPSVTYPGGERGLPILLSPPPEPVAAVSTPFAHVSASYKIENPTAEAIEIDFGFPILRGIRTSPHGMMLTPDVYVTMDGKSIDCKVISNSALYGIVRQRARETIDKAVAQDSRLSALVADARAKTGDRAEVRTKLAEYMKAEKRWNERDAALMAAYACLDLDSDRKLPARDGTFWWQPVLQELINANLGPLAAIGEQKATQFLAQLASKFDPKAASTYESIFTAWGGDARERSVDLKTGKVRPREMTADSKDSPGDLSVYARVDYLDPNLPITDEERESCKAILKNLPVVFTFAPMNLLHYRVTFPAKSTQTLTVSYSQYPYLDTREPRTYQLAYVVHPASLWKSFGPINLKVAVSPGVTFKSSVPCKNSGLEAIPIPSGARFSARSVEQTPKMAVYRGVVGSKTGEVFLAVGFDSWQARNPPPAQPIPQPLRGVAVPKPKP
ncbi:MAG: hypothetical protein Q7T82_15870 [Armatimonadota bacterium]|nr:hypothetical protein [Armatimonadota bacterium]